MSDKKTMKNSVAIDTKFLRVKPSEEKRNINVVLCAKKMDALKEANINISAVMRDAVDKMYEAIS